MSILERFFGRKEKNSSNIQGVLVANAEIDNPLSLVVVFDTLPEIIQKNSPACCVIIIPV